MIIHDSLVRVIFLREFKPRTTRSIVDGDQSQLFVQVVHETSPGHDLGVTVVDGAATETEALPVDAFGSSRYSDHLYV